jgi:pimeloyl-ACP methyl ester carboxylesterase
MRATGMLAPSAPREVFDRVARIAADVSLSGLDAAIRMMGAADNRPLLAQLRLPILLIDADMDRVVGPERTAALAALLPKAHRVTLKGVGHAPYLEDPERFNAAVERFVDS